MNDRAAQLERLLEFARGLAREDLTPTQMSRRLCEYVRTVVDPRSFHVAIAEDDGSVRAEYAVIDGVEQTPETLNGQTGTRFELRHGDRELGVVTIEANEDTLASRKADLEVAIDFFSLAVAGVQKVRATERRIDRDTLTSLYNRNYGMRRLQEELQRASRSNTGVCVLLVDVDGVEALNTRYGHQTGDSAIRTVGDALRSICRHSDVLCRYAGDRFLIVYPEFSGDNAGPIAGRVRTQIEMRVLPVPGGAIGLKASIGAAIGREGTDALALIRESESALLRDKTERRRRSPN
ncbi:MAG TPA: GGDEF domain-containing protein [Candidatus Baltobacteraceae bacterium]|jgi:diguanylate cyclase (GGDEF)-like protein|nr:GGDEF domain-containing protein [Candidatus Baltobacteraceae bacterium]